MAVRKLTLPTKVVIGLVLGIIVGLLFGTYVEKISVVGTIYIMLFQTVAIPYIICTLLVGLGSLSPKLAFKLLSSGWSIYICIILIIFSMIFTLGYGLSQYVTATTMETSVNTSTNLLALIVPQNLFNALSNNYVPASVIFFVLFGVTLQHIKNKKTFFELLETIRSACLKFWYWLAQLAPYAAFCLMASTVGALHVESIAVLGEYIGLVFFTSGVLVFWLLPVIITSCVDMSYRQLLSQLRPALVMSAATTLAVIALPYIRKVTEDFLGETSDKQETKDVVLASLMISYPFAQLGNFLIYFFILIATVVVNHPIMMMQRYELLLLTYFSSIGSPTTAVNAVSFLLDWLHFPKDTIDIFLGLMPITRYAQVALSVMGISFVTILVTAAYHRRLKFRPFKLICNLMLVAIVTAAVILGLRWGQVPPSVRIYRQLSAYRFHPSITQGMVVTVVRRLDEKIYSQSS